MKDQRGGVGEEGLAVRARRACGRATERGTVGGLPSV